jgi:hypothetical protein
MIERPHDEVITSPRSGEPDDYQTRHRWLVRLAELLNKAGANVVLSPPRRRSQPWSLTIASPVGSRWFWSRGRVIVYCGGADGTFFFITGTGAVLGTTDQLHAVVTQLTQLTQTPLPSAAS